MSLSGIVHSDLWTEHRSVLNRLPKSSAAQACLCMLIQLLHGSQQLWKTPIFPS